MDRQHPANTVAKAARPRQPKSAMECIIDAVAAAAETARLEDEVVDASGVVRCSTTTPTPDSCNQSTREDAGESAEQERVRAKAEQDAKAAQRAAEEKERAARARYVLVTQMRGAHMIFVRFDGNEAFLGACKENPMNGLLVTLRDASSADQYVVSPRFYSHAKAMAVKTTVCEALGFTGRIFDSVIRASWSHALWTRCNRSLFRLLQLLSQVERQKKQFERTGQASRDDQVGRAIHGEREARQRALYDEFVAAYRSFERWLDTLIDDEYRLELMPHFMFVVFQHCYYELVTRCLPEHAAGFFRQFSTRFYRDTLYSACSAELSVMEVVRTPEHMMERDECRNVLLQSNGRGGWLSVPCRRVFGVSPGCLVYLQHNLDMHVHARISTVLRTYVDFEAIPASAIRAQRRGKLGGFVRTASPARYYTLDKRRASAGSAVALGRNRDTGARKRQKKKRLPATVRR